MGEVLWSVKDARIHGNLQIKKQKFLITIQKLNRNFSNCRLVKYLLHYWIKKKKELV